MQEQGNDAFVNGDYKQAADRYTEALRQQDLNVADRIKILSNRAASWLKLSKFTQAREDACTALNWRPKDTSIKIKLLRRRATANESLSNFTQALQDLCAAVQLQSLCTNPPLTQEATDSGGPTVAKQDVSAIQSLWERTHLPSKQLALWSRHQPVGELKRASSVRCHSSVSCKGKLYQWGIYPSALAPRSPCCCRWPQVSREFWDE